MTVESRACPACQTPLPEQAHFCLNCGTATPTDPGVPPRTGATLPGELGRVRKVLVAHYKVIRVLGEGGMATVYLAEDAKHHRKVAIKVMRPELAATLGADRFLREVEIAAQLNHPHILPVFDSGETDGLLWYVMPYVEGESLQDKLRREAQLPIEDAVRIAREVAEALAYAHQRNIIHRDIKPANILMSEGHAMVADFGIARAMGAGATITKTGLAVGTPQYMSPEQATGSEGVDGRADVYAVGCVLYEMVAGETPFTGPTPQAIISRVLTESPRSLTTSRDQLPAGLDQVVRKALARSPADRYQTASAFGQALRTLPTYQGGTESTEVSPRVGPAGLQVWGLFGFVAVVTLGLFYGMVNRWGLPKWALFLAVGLLVAGAVMLVTTGRVEARRRAGGTVGGLGRLFTWRNAALGGVAALAVWALVVTALVIKGPGSAPVGGVVRLAVLPFENRGTADDAYFVNGIADQVRGKLTGLGAFQVAARSSSDQYKGTTKTPKVIGQELGVDYLLGATVTWARSGGGQGRVQVSPELIDVRTGASRWQQSFDADLTDVFKVQASIAEQVAGALGIALGGTEQAQLAERPTQNVSAYDRFLKGEALSGSDPATLRQASGFYQEAVALDSNFAIAWSRLAGSLSRLYSNGTPDPGVARRAKAAAERSAAIDPKGAPGHAALATYYRLVLKDVPRAEEQTRLAVVVSPNDPTLLRSASAQEAAQGRWEEALVHSRRSQQLDPRSPAAAATLAGILLAMHQLPEALAAGNAALALDPTDLGAIDQQALVYLAMGDLDGARQVIKAAPATLSQPAVVSYMATYQDLFWVLDDAQQQLLLRLTPASFFDDPAAWASVMMQTYGDRGEKARARAYADTAVAAFQGQILQAPQDPQLHVLYGLALAYAGKKTQAIAEGEKAMTLMPLSRDHVNGAYMQHQTARIYAMLGEPDKATAMLEGLLKANYILTAAWLRIDPSFTPLKGNPRFEKLLRGE